MLENNETKLADAESAARKKLAEESIRKYYIQIEKIKEEIKKLEKAAKENAAVVGSTMETVKTIQDVASNTRILGFNAYVEASHAKENGKGFGVITQEIRSLADKSMEAADRIENAIQTISDSTKNIDTLIQNTQKMVNTATGDMENFLKILEEDRIHS